MGKSASSMPYINLAKKNDLWIDTFIHWALNTGRFIIIVTETIALIAFLSRFTLDRQIIDLHGKIKQEQAIVLLLKHNEDTYRNLQERLALIDVSDKQSTQQIKNFFVFLNLVPSEVQVNRINFSEGKVQLEVNTHSTAVLAKLIRNIKTNPSVTEVSVDKIENKVSDATIVISLTAILKKNTI